MEFLQHFRLLEEVIGGNGKELGGIHCAVLIQESSTIAPDLAPKLLVVFLQDAGPGYEGRMVLKNRRVVTAGKRAVELVRKLVEDNVMTVMNIGSTVPDIIP